MIKMPYEQRVKCYEAEKQKLMKKNLTPAEYEKQNKKLIEKWRI